MKSTATRYGTMAVALHWATALIVLVLVASGFRSGSAVDPAAKATALAIHLPVAGLVLCLTLWRLFWWARFDRKPGPPPGVPDLQAAAARWVHRGLYGLLLVLLASGIAMSAMSGLPAAVFGDAPMPDLADLPPRAGHGIAARLLLAAVLLHAAAALHHHVIRRDGALRRMWFARD